MTTLPPTRLALAALAAAVLAPAALGQSILYAFHGDLTGDGLGASVSGAGDVNGDGRADLIVGIWRDDTLVGFDAGSVRIISGADGSTLFVATGDDADDYFGTSVDGAGDVNGDGLADVIVGACGDDDNGDDAGSARVLSGLNGSILYTFHGDAAGDRLGHSVGGAGDVDGDGFADLIVGAYAADDNGLDAGSARVLSGADGSILYTFHGQSAEDRFGISVAGAGDVDGDGLADLIVGAHWLQHGGQGYARVFSGADGSTLHTFGGSAEDAFGHSVSGAGDVDGDGFADLIVGAYLDDSSGLQSGRAHVFSGKNGSLLYAFDGDAPFDFLGASVSGAGDVNGDGFADLITGAYGADPNGLYAGMARVFSGADGSLLYTLPGDSAGDLFGYSVGLAGDVNGDAFDDLVVGAWGDDGNGPYSGSARVFSGCDGLGSSYCGPANLNSTGSPAAVHACGSVLAADNRFNLSATVLPPGQFGYFLTSQTQGFVPFVGGGQGNLCLGGQIGRFRKQIQSSGPSGRFSIAVDLTQMPMGIPVSVMPGETWNFQAWFRDRNPTPTSNFTDGVSVVFQ